MRKKIESKIGFADSEFISYERTDFHLLVKINAWNGNLIRISFLQFVGALDYGAGDISGLIEETDKNDFFKQVISRVYETIPEEIPYRLYQFLDLDNKPIFQIVAQDLEIV